jgi:hypothetical protein
MKIVFRQQKQELEKARKRVQSNAKRSLARQVKRMVYDVHNYILSATPVYSCNAVANFQWSMDSPANGLVKPARFPTDGLGKTSVKPLGSEAARGANEAIANASLAKIDFSDPFRRIYVVNNVPYFADLEYGTYNFVTKTEPRTPPAGIFRGASAMLRNKYPGVRARFTT